MEKFFQDLQPLEDGYSTFLWNVGVHYRQMQCHIAEDATQLRKRYESQLQPHS
jgi:hypothetical protein